MIEKYKNHMATGIVLGLIFPLLAFWIYTVFNKPPRTFFESLAYYKLGGVLSHAISLSVIANLIPFFAFLNTKRDRSAQGVIGGSFVYVFIVLILLLT
jgi:hypothetical protein